MCVHLPFQYKKATQALNFLAVASGGLINKMKAIKLVFFADRYHLRKYGRPITNDEYYAMERGPVNSGVKDIAEMSDFLGEREREYASKFIAPLDRYNVRSLAGVEAGVFSQTDLEALEFAWETFGNRDQWELAEITHNYPEWKKHECELEHESRVRMDYSDFFEDPEQGVEQCYSLSAQDKEDRLQEIKELSQLHALWS